jgi:hypothetical protein
VLARQLGLADSTVADKPEQTMAVQVVEHQTLELEHTLYQIVK